MEPLMPVSIFFYYKSAFQNLKNLLLLFTISIDVKIDRYVLFALKEEIHFHRSFMEP